MTTWSQHVANWKDCTRCPLHLTRTHVVLARGTLPCDVCFVGEAPGDSEDELARPFAVAAPAGSLLQSIIDEAMPKSLGVTYSVTNIVGCIPKDKDGRKSGAPSNESIQACQPKIEEFLEVAKPRLVVAVGAEARNKLEQGFKHSIKIPKLPNGSRVAQIDILHPAKMLTLNSFQKDDAIRRATLKIRNAVEKLK